MFVQHPNPLWMLTCLLHLLQQFSCICLGYAWERTCVTTSCCVCGPCHLPIFSVLLHLCIVPGLRPWLNGRAAGNPLGSHVAAISRKPMSRNGSREVHTTSPAWSFCDDQLPEHVHHREDSGSWSRRARELSEQEMFACLTRADSWDESEQSSCTL